MLPQFWHAAVRLILLAVLLTGVLVARPAAAAEFNMDITAASIRPGALVSGPMLGTEAISNRVVLLEFWGLNCPPCIRSMPMLEELHTTLGPHGLVVIGAHAQGGSAAELKPQVAKLGVTFTILENASVEGGMDFQGIPHCMLFGRYQDAIWTGEPWLWHARLSQAMNLKLLDPRDVVSGAERAWRKGKVPLEAAEGFIRQVIGWREYVRGVYWHFMPEYLDRNSLGAEAALPAFYWSAETEMNCLKDAIGQTMKYGYAHHIQRLMVTGLFAMLLGVRPQEVHRWYLAVYVDAVEWVELPNTVGMSQFADGGVMASKPYCATGAYIDRMSNACKGCRYNPKKATGPEAGPFTTLYWDFLARHEKLLAKNQRMAMQLKNLSRKEAGELRSIRRQADELKASLG